MTLVVATVSNGEAQILSDTRLTPNQALLNQEGRTKRIPFKDDVLKTIIVNSTVCVSFAGDAEWGISSVLHLLSQEDVTYDHAVDSLYEKHCEKDKITDFIVVDASGKFTRIRGGAKLRSSGEVDECAIGSDSAYTALKDFSLDIPPDGFRFLITDQPSSRSGQPHEVGEKMFEQFLSLLYSDHHDEVGGLLIRVVTDNGEFKYMGYIDSIRERPYLELEEGQVLGPGSPSEGGYRYQITEILSQDGYRLPLFYTQHGALGVVFQRDSLKPKVYTKKTPIEFIEELWRDTKVKLDGCFVSPLALIAVGEKHFKANDLARAEHYFLWADECADNTNVCQIRWNSSEESQTAYDNTLKSRRWTSLQHGSILESGDKKLTKAHINRFLGAIAFLQGEFQMSIQYVLTSIWHFGEYGDAFVDLARLHAAHGDAASAQLHINTAFRIDPKNPEIARVVEQINEELSIRGEKDQVMLPAN